MTRGVVLDSGPLGLLCHSKDVDESFACTSWLARITRSGVEVIVPEIIDYELRRELTRLRALKSLIRLDSIVLAPSVRYLPIDTAAMKRAAHLWAEVRREGKPTSHPHALDGDVILAAQTLGLDDPDIVVATTNVDHLARFVPAAPWQEITG